MKKQIRLSACSRQLAPNRERVVGEESPNSLYHWVHHAANSRKCEMLRAVMGNPLLCFLLLQIMPCLLFTSLSNHSQAEAQVTEDMIRLELFSNGDSLSGINIELTPDDCASADDKGLNAVVLTKAGLLNDYERDQQKNFILPSLFNGQAQIVRSCNDILNYIESNDDGAASLYIVPDSRPFIFPTHSVGHNTTLKYNEHHFTSLFPHEEGRTITLETLSIAPRVFKIHNFFNSEEADFLIDFALKITEEDTKLKRSSTGAAGYNVNPVRTSDNAFDSQSHVAISLKRRGFSLLGLPYDEEFADGLQVLRYNQSTAYISHLDWIDGNSDHDYDSAVDGTNRYATIFLYLTDVEEGGETLFPQARPPEKTATQANTREEALEETNRYLEAMGISDMFPHNSWQRKMVADCRTMFTVKPKRAEAILFYSQNPDGTTDKMSIHGGCPVIKGTKWAANLWVWNGPRNGYMIRDENTGLYRRKTPEERAAEEELYASEEEVPKASPARSITFINVDVPQEYSPTVYWEDQLWSKMEIGKRIDVNSFVDHNWHVKANGQSIPFTVQEPMERQFFTLRMQKDPKGELAIQYDITFGTNPSGL